MDLGFPEQREPAWLTNRYFPSKVGGKPAWLELGLLPKPKDLQCPTCKTPLAFLCQIYAPFEDDHNFHRTLYVFICRTATCQLPNSAANLIVLRSQLGRINDYYSAEPPLEDGAALPQLATKKPLCLACGCVGLSICARCKNANYCSTQHQRAHWPYHKVVCNVDAPAAHKNDAILLPNISFPEMEIDIHECNDEQQTVSAKETVSDSERLSEFEKLAAEGKTGVLNDISASELEKYALNADDDKHFNKFKKEIDEYPDQILRYKRNGAPLWIADIEHTLGSLQIPDCEYCGGPRAFEFQIMPQMLLLLKDEHLDWGVLVIYSCRNSCKPSAEFGGYLREFVIKQDIIKQ